MKRRIPKKAVEDLVETCEWVLKLGSKRSETPQELFSEYLSLMDRYADYFFSEPWPEEYDKDAATTITDEDEAFLFGNIKEFYDRRMTVCLRKNMYLGGFEGIYGLLRVQYAIKEKYFKPLYEWVMGEFEEMLKESNDARVLLDTLKADLSISFIHDCFTDFLDGHYPDKDERKVINEILELLHTEEGMPPCDDYFCSWSRRMEEEAEAKQQRQQTEASDEP